MNQYCRYCQFLVAGNGIYCTLKEKEMSEEQAKHTNKCTAFLLNPMDAFAENEKGYQPRRKKLDDGEQIEMRL